jgi:hypothetical protein
MATIEQAGRGIFFTVECAHRAKGRDGNAEEQLSVDLPRLDTELLGTLTDDVMDERTSAYRINPGPEYPILVRDLRKVFPGSRRGLELVAVSNLSLVVSQGECFGCAP